METPIVGEVLSVNVGLPRKVEWRGYEVKTAIFKQPVEGRVVVAKLNLLGDGQADLSVHGGIDKAVYVYPAQYYSIWRKEYPDINFLWGMFGENLTVSGLADNEVNIGDRFQIGTSELIVTQPRLPCYKLGVRFGRNDIIKRFAREQLTGYYLAVVKEGDIGTGDKIYLLARDQNEVRVSDVVKLFSNPKSDVAAARRAIQIEALPESWKDFFLSRLEEE